MASLDSSTSSESVNSFKSSSSSSSSFISNESLYNDLMEKAEEIIQSEPLLAHFLKSTITHPENKTFESVVARTISTRLVQFCGSNPLMCCAELTKIFLDAMKSDELEHGHIMTDAVRMDMLACTRRDPACENPLEVLLYFKGFASLVCHRAAKRLWKKKLVRRSGSAGAPPSLSRHVSLWLQSQASAAFGVDIHPAAEIGAGVMFDHGTGIVIGETATVGDDCTFMHGVTLGGTGKENGDRHPKVAQNVLVGAGASILGNIKIGSGAKIGAGSLVLSPIPHGATAVGAPAKIIGFSKERRVGSTMDLNLKNVVHIGALDSDTAPGLIRSGSDSSLSETEKRPSRRSRPAMFRIRESSQSVRNANNLCPFRSFRCPEGLPRGAMSFQCVHDALADHCSKDEIGEVFMSLLKHNLGHDYISSENFNEDFLVAAQKYTRLDDAKCTSIMEQISRCARQKNGAKL